MTFDFNTEELRLQTQSVLSTITELENQRQSLNAELDALEKERDSILPQMGWREKYIGGFLGGNSSNAKRLGIVTSNITKCKDHLAQFDKDLEVHRTGLIKAVTEFLSKRSNDYQKLAK